MVEAGSVILVDVVDAVIVPSVRLKTRYVIAPLPYDPDEPVQLSVIFVPLCLAEKFVGAVTLALCGFIQITLLLSEWPPYSAMILYWQEAYPSVLAAMESDVAVVEAMTVPSETL